MAIRAPATVRGMALGSEPADQRLPTDKLVDITALALRMSSPFNPSYWLAAA